MKLSHLTQLLAIVVACAGATSAMAQAKTDGEWRGVAGASFSATSGNSTTSNALVNVDMARLTVSDKISTAAFINYGSSKANDIKSTVNNKWGIAGQYDYNLTPRIYAFGKLGVEGDKIINLSLRSAASAGIGYKVITEPATTLDVFAGLMNINSKYSLDQTVGGITGTSFSSTNLLIGEESTHKISDTVFFKQRVELLPRIAGNGGTLAKASANLGVKLNSTMALNVGLINSYDGSPAAGLKKNDLAFFTGLTMNLGK